MGIKEMNQLTVSDALLLVKAFAQSCRENGDADMRNILNFVRALERDYSKGMLRDELFDLYVQEGSDVD